MRIVSSPSVRRNNSKKTSMVPILYIDGFIAPHRWFIAPVRRSLAYRYDRGGEPAKKARRPFLIFLWLRSGIRGRTDLMVRPTEGLRNLFEAAAGCPFHLDRGCRSWPLATSLRRANPPNRPLKAWPSARARRRPSLFPCLLPRNGDARKATCSSLLARCPSSAATAGFIRCRRNSSISSAAATRTRGHQDRAACVRLPPSDSQPRPNEPTKQTSE